MKPILKDVFKNEGFTIIELLVIITILGILVGIGIQQYGAAQKNAANTIHQANIRILKSVGQMGIMDWDVPKQNVEWTKDFRDTSFNGWGEGWGKFLEEWPVVPVSRDGYSEEDEYIIFIKNSGEVKSGIKDDLVNN